MKKQLLKQLQLRSGSSVFIYVNPAHVSLVERNTRHKYRPGHSTPDESWETTTIHVFSSCSHVMQNMTSYDVLGSVEEVAAILNQP